MNKMLLSVAAITALLQSAALATEISLQIEIAATGDFQRHIMTYDCATETPLTVTYINAAPNFLAVVPVPEEDEELIFASVVSASGASYASGRWLWSTKGTEASLQDSTLGDEAEPVLSCSELSNAP